MTPLEIFLSGIIIGLLVAIFLLRGSGQSQYYRG
jgi:hypothetical protein